MKSLSSNRSRPFTVAVVIAASVAGLAGCRDKAYDELIFERAIAECRRQGQEPVIEFVWHGKVARVSGCRQRGVLTP